MPSETNSTPARCRRSSCPRPSGAGRRSRGGQVRGQPVLGEQLRRRGATVLLLGGLPDRSIAPSLSSPLRASAQDEMRRISRRWSRSRRRSTARSKTTREPRRELLQRIGVQLRQRSPARRAVAVQEPDGDRRPRGSARRRTRASRSVVEKRVARGLRVVDVGHEPRLPAAQQLAFEQRVGQPQRRAQPAGAPPPLCRRRCARARRRACRPRSGSRRRRSRSAAAAAAAAQRSTIWLTGPSCASPSTARRTRSQRSEPQRVVSGHHSSPRPSGSAESADRRRISSRYATSRSRSPARMWPASLRRSTRLDLGAVLLQLGREREDPVVDDARLHAGGGEQLRACGAATGSTAARRTRRPPARARRPAS